eukprot:m.985552 g.985552  ORF g.985552 m.985552 type:complete len:537 (+) comp23984_c0_seq3:357-1967(+)
MAPPNPSMSSVCGRMPKLPPAEGADFDFSDNPMHHEYMFLKGSERDRKKKAGMRWVLLFLSGIAVAVMYFCMDKCIDAIQDARMDALGDNMAEHDYFKAWIVHFTIMTVLLVPATILVLIEPQAGGSGIPEIIAYLNGIVPPRSFDGFVVAAKIVGTVLAVASGLAIGPEGPTIHLGAAVTLNIVAFADYIIGGTFKALSNEHDKRLFLAAGAAIGIACAFRAPIGGVVFALEEAISHFDASLIVRVYFACVIGYYIMMILFEGRRLDTESFTEYKITKSCYPGYNAEEILLFAILGVFGGLLGGLFNKLNMKLNYWRKKHVSPYGIRRFAEVITITFITSMLVVFVPVNSPCTSPNQLTSHLKGSPDIQDIARMSTQGNLSTLNDKICLSAPVAALVEEVNHVDLDHLSELYDKKYLRNSLCKNKSQYNELESLLQGSGHKSVGLLFEEGGDNIFGIGSLSIFLVVYFFMALIAAGSSVPHGLVIPMLTIGGCMGRIFALVVNKIRVESIPVDPGAWAQVGVHLGPCCGRRARGT